MNMLFSRRKKNRPLISAFIVLALFGTVALSVSAAQLPKAWMDRASGYAIGGYDPVDYFVKGDALRPTGQIEAFWGGVSWKFRNTGNMDAFLSHPRTYVPRFGGADPYLLARGKSVLGTPVLFDIYKDRLYLFYNGVSLSSWKKNRADLVIRATKAWSAAAISLGLDAAEPVNPPASSSQTGFLPIR